MPSVELCDRCLRNVVNKYTFGGPAVSRQASGVNASASAR